MNVIVINDVFFNPQKRMIDRDGRIIKIRNKESELLSLLCSHYPDPLSREDIEKALWGGSYLTDNTLTQTISNLRHALDDKKHELVITIPKKGYRIGIKPEFFTDDILQHKYSDKNNVIECDTGNRAVTGNNIMSIFKGNSLYYNFFLFILCLISFFIFFDVTSRHYQIKLVDVDSLPILINLDKIQDKNFLSIYQQHPYVLLKKRKDGEYVVCKTQGGELICEKK